MAESYCDPYDECTDLDGRLIIDRTIEGPPLARSIGSRPRSWAASRRRPPGGPARTGGGAAADVRDVKRERRSTGTSG